jgi:hypothetical protein
MRSKLNNIFHNPGGRWLASILLILGMAGSAAAILDVFSFPGGFTASRVFLLIIPVLTGLLCVWFLVKANRNWTESLRRITGWVANPHFARFMDTAVPLFWVVLLVTAFLSPDGLGRWNVVYDRINGLLQLAFLYVTKIWIFWLFQKKQFSDLADKSNRPAVLAGLVLAGFIVLVVLFIACTGMGIGPGTQYWGKSGIPVLHWQLGSALVVMSALVILDGRLFDSKPSWIKYLAVFVLLWLAAFLLWQSIPTPVSRFVTASYPPNYTGYPYSDAGDYALEGQMILSGNGFPYGFLDKPLHLTMLAVISWLAGSDYARMMLLQTGLMALIPGLIYLLISKISNRPAGITAGAVVLFMQANNLAIADRVQATNVKMAMSEPLASLLLILFALSVVNWWKSPRRSWLHAAISGALLGLTALVRLNALVILPFVLLVWLFAFNIHSRRAWYAAFVFVLFCLLGQLPWAARNQAVNGNAADSYISKVIGVVIKRRINPIVELVPVRKTPVPGAEQPANTPPPTTDEPEARPNDWRTLADSFVRTGLHNMAAVGLSLPASIYHEGIEETIRQPYWDQEWNGSFTPYGQIMLAVSLLVVALGFALGWKRSGVLSLIPLLILLPYLLSNSLSMVSGGRYIVPVDWVLPSYFSMGLAGLTVWLFCLKPAPETEPADSPADNKWLWVQLVVILVAAILPTALSLLIPKEFKLTDNAAILAEVKKVNPEWPAGYSTNDLEKLMASPDSSLKAGRAMFPRWMKTGEGDTAGRGSAFSALSFDHQSFSVISDDKYPFEAILPVDQAIDPLPNASKVILAGCKTEAYFDAAVLIVLEPTPKAYIRKDPGLFTCPLPKP